MITTRLRPAICRRWRRGPHAPCPPSHRTDTRNRWISGENNGTFAITNSTVDHVYFDNASCLTEGFGAGTSYVLYDDISGAATESLMPDPTTSGATKVGRIQCSSLASQSVTVAAGASAALMMVAPARIRTVFLRAGLTQVANANGSNPSNLIAGHAVVGYTDAP